MTYRNLIFVLLFIFSTGCVLVDYDNFTNYKKDFKNDKIKTAGYFSFSYTDTDKAVVTDYLFLYNDGTVYIPGYSDKPKKTYIDSLKYQNDFENHFTWGAYIINADTLKVQTFYPNKGLFKSPRWTIATRNWKIINDTSIIEIDFRYKKGDSLIINKNDNPDIYKFESCNKCKPDSMNFFKKSSQLANAIQRRHK